MTKFQRQREKEKKKRRRKRGGCLSVARREIAHEKQRMTKKTRKKMMIYLVIGRKIKEYSLQ